MGWVSDQAHAGIEAVQVWDLKRDVAGLLKVSDPARLAHLGPRLVERIGKLREAQQKQHQRRYAELETLISEYLNLTAEMIHRGYSEADIRKIWGGNYLRVLRRVQELATPRAPTPSGPGT